MIEFRTIKVKEIGKVITGHTPPTQCREYYGEEFVFIKPTDINIGERYVIQTEEKFSKLAFDKYKKSLIPPLSTCVVTIGSLGKKMCFTDTHCFTNQAINSIIPFEDFDNLFVYYLFSYINPAVENLSNGTASGRDNVSKASFENLNLIVPKCKKYQQKIGSILCLYDDLLETNKQRIKLLEQTAKELYKEWFVRMRFPNYKNVKFEKGVPEKWTIGRLDDFLTFKTGKLNSNAASENGVYPFFTCSNNDFKVDTYSFDTEAVLLAGNNANGEFPLKYFKGKFDAYQRTYIVKPKYDSLSHKYVYFYFFERLEFLQAISIGATTQFLTTQMLKKMWITLPSTDIMDKFSAIVDPVFEQIETLKQQNTQLCQIRDRLLPRLISGKLKVKAAMEEVTCP